MAKLIFYLVGLLFSSLIFQVSTMGTIEFDNSTDVGLLAEDRFLLSNVLLTTCRNRLNRPSAVLPGLTVTLIKLANNRLYFFSPALPAALHLSWEAARKFCVDHGMHLVILNTAAENSVVFAKAVELGLATANAGSWIGIRDVSGIPNMQWVPPGATPVLNLFGVTPLPNECGGYREAAAATVNTAWRSFPCAGPLPFICEMEPPCSQIL